MYRTGVLAARIACAAVGSLGVAARAASYVVVNTNASGAGSFAAAWAPLATGLPGQPGQTTYGDTNALRHQEYEVRVSRP